MSEGCAIVNSLQIDTFYSDTLIVNGNVSMTGDLLGDNFNPCIIRVDGANQIIQDNTDTILKCGAINPFSSLKKCVKYIKSSGKFITNVSGWYTVSASCSANTTFQNNISLRVFKNNSEIFGQSKSISTKVNVQSYVYLNPADSIDIRLIQTSGESIRLIDYHITFSLNTGTSQPTLVPIETSDNFVATDLLITDALFPADSGNIKIIDAIDANNRIVSNIGKVNTNMDIVIDTPSSASVTGTNVVAIGPSTQAYSTNCVSLGNAAKSLNTSGGSGRVAIGYNVSAARLGDIIIGNSSYSKSSSLYSIAIGGSIYCEHAYSICVGYNSFSDQNASQSTSISIGYGAYCRYSFAVSMGYKAKAFPGYGQNFRVAIGTGSRTQNSNTVIIGWASLSNAASSTGIGKQTNPTSANSTILRKRVIGGSNTAVWSNATDGAPGELGLMTSSGRFKKNIRPLEEIGDKIDQIKVYRYQLEEKVNTSHKNDYIGILAEELESIFPEFVGYENDGVTPGSVSYPELTVIALREIQSIRQRVSALEN